jgi:hypothetical protein
MWIAAARERIKLVELILNPVHPSDGGEKEFDFWIFFF